MTTTDSMIGTVHEIDEESIKYRISIMPDYVKTTLLALSELEKEK